MDPFSAGLGIVGLGIQLFSGFSQANTAKQIAGVNQDIAGQEQNINQQKQLQMQLEAHRSTLQNYRNAQRARSQALAAGVEDNAQFGSGLPGGLAGISSQAAGNAQAVNQNLQIGQTIFGYNNKISQDKMQLASLGAQSAQEQAWGSLGGALVKNSGTIGGLGKDIGAAGSDFFDFLGKGSLTV